MKTPKWIPGNEILIAAIIVTSFVALIAFLASYQHQYELVVHHNQPHWVGALYPLSVDLLIVATTLALWFGSSRKLRRPLGVWAVFGLAVAASAIANRADDPSPWGDIGAYISMWPAAALLGAFETVVWMIRKNRKVDNESDNRETTSGHETGMVQSRQNTVLLSGQTAIHAINASTVDSSSGRQNGNSRGGPGARQPNGIVTLGSGRTIQRKTDATGQKRR